MNKVKILSYHHGKIDTKKLADFIADVMEEIAQREDLIPQDNSHKAFRTYAAVMSKLELFKEALTEGFRRYKEEAEHAQIQKETSCGRSYSMERR